MNTTLELKRLERRLRATKVYREWVRRNKTAWCLRCDSTTNIECHHVVSLYHILLGFWKLFGDNTEVMAHVTAMHQDDRVECVTLCSKCHEKRHPGRIVRSNLNEIHISEWAAIPRVFWFDVSHSTKDKDALGLVSLQTLFGIGWHVLNGKAEDRILQLHRRRFADLLGKTPGTSFNQSLDASIRALKKLDVIVGKHRKGNNLELHLAPAYIKRLKDNPWFLPLNEVQTNDMCTLMLRWFLNHQCRRRNYRITLSKLQDNIGIKTDRPSVVLKVLKRACKDIPWAGMEYDGDMCHFTLKKRLPTPIFQLRDMLDDSLAH